MVGLATSLDSDDPVTEPQVSHTVPSDGPSVDLLVGGGFVLTMDQADSTYYPGAVAIDKGRIVAVGPADSVVRRFKARRSLDAAGQVVMPGLVNAHTHIAMGYLRGLADDMKLYDWLPFIAPVLNEADAATDRAFARLACMELIKGGVTTIADTSTHLPDVVSALLEFGLRGVLAPGVTDLNGTRSLDEISDESIGYQKDFNGAGQGRITIMFSFHTPFTCSKGLMRLVRELADRCDAGIQIHLAETRDEREEIIARYGHSPTALCDDVGVLGPDVLAAHFVWVTDQDIDIAVERGIRLAHNPVSNMKLASGMSPVVRLLDAGLSVGIGTDSCVSNNRLDMFESMKLASLLQKGLTSEASALPASTVLRMATSLGARAVGLDDEIGVVGVGKKADLILVDFRQKPHLVPHFFELPNNVISHLVYAVLPTDVASVVIDGAVVMHDRRLISIDEGEVLDMAQRTARDLLARTGFV